MEKVVEIRNLTKKFGDFTAVNNISLSVEKGEIFGFLGPNGAGKTTTIKMLCGILMPTAGEGRVSGYDIISEQEKIKTIIGYMSQRFSLYEDLTVVENLEFYGSIYGLEGTPLKQAIERVVDMAGIGERKNDLVKNLPGGMKQRLALGGAILHDPPILFLDEPTSGVDPLMRRNFWDIIYRFSEEGRTIFVTTHYMDEAEHCNRIALVIAGEIIALDSPESLKRNFTNSVYSIVTDNFLEVFEKIRYQDFIVEAAIFGADIHILCEAKVPVQKKIVAFFKEHHIPSYSIHRITPSLEDVFVSNARKYSL
ncbi:MAG TPA: ABC transporter ATP-binding protein [Spirochaetota bacterium]|nr:ABC transporter ATP-binding protein [Spirochaetota bacterium]